MFAEVLIATIALVAPKEGDEIAMLAETQRNYLALPRAERFAKFDNGDFRKKLAKCGDYPQTVELKWTDDASNAVYLVSVDDRIHMVSNRCSVRITNLEPNHAYSWSVRVPGDFNAAEGSFTTAADLPRIVFAEGVPNLRDMGGWKTKDGRRVRMNMAYRSAGLRNSARKSGDSLLNVRYSPGRQRVTEFGLQTLAQDLGIKTDIELRSLKETMCMNETIVPGARWVKVPFLAYDFIADDVKGRIQFAKIFREFTKAENYPILFHCSGGRDRTGTVAFLLNGLLGVSEDDLCRDWEVTAFGDSALSLSSDRIVRLLDYLHTLAGDDVNGQIESYVRSCGVSAEDIARFREIMLEGGAQ